jgi:hypothetical protein
MNKLAHFIKHNRSVITLLFCITVFSIPFIIYFSMFSNGLSDDHNYWGSFGSYIGGLVSSIFSFASFLAVLYSFNRSEKEKYMLDEEKRIFQYLELIKESRDNLYCIVNEKQEYKGQQLITAYCASYASISFNNSELKKRGITLDIFSKMPEFNGICVNHLFLSNSIDSFMKLVKLSFEYILNLKALNKAYYLELVSSVLTNQDKQAFMHYGYDFMEENNIIEKYIYEDENQKKGIKNMKDAAQDFIRQF